MSYIVYSYPEGISLNGRQYLLDDNTHEIKEFASISDVFTFLNNKGVGASTLDELEVDFGIFITEDES